MNLTRRVATSIAAGALLSGVAITSAHADTPRVGVGVGLVSSNAVCDQTVNVQCRNGQWYIAGTPKRGDTINAVIKVKNAGTGVETIRTDVTQAWSPTGGQSIQWNNVLDPWNSTSPSAVTLNPNETANVNVTVTVPEDAALGSHMAAVWATYAPEGVNGVGAGIREYLVVTE